jgi:hypothetical protein
MTPQEAQNIGRTKTLKATGLIVAILLIIFIFNHTMGGFTEGILFVLETILNIHFIVILTILFSLTYLFGGIAGKEILLKKKNRVMTSLKYSVLIILIISVYISIIDVIKYSEYSSNNSQRLLTTYFFTLFIKTFNLTFFPIGVIWLWATNQMRLVEDKRIE